jgi:PhzF family phenazine biosynthesis protein
MPPLPFRQVDVFTARPFLGNPLAVFVDAATLDDATIRAAARWTNLSETTFVFPPSSPASDYRVRIMTPDSELQFAGHPTLGTSAALLAEGKIRVRDDGTVVQECGVGLVTIRVLSLGAATGSPVIGRLAFRAPPVRHSTPLEVAPVLAALGLEAQANVFAGAVRPHAVNIGIAWLLVEVPTQGLLLATAPSLSALEGFCQASGAFGVTFFAPAAPAAPGGAGTDYDLELRTFLLENGKVVEDPVCGSANACVAHFLQLQPALRDRYLEAGRKTSFVARQGSALKREGRIYVTYEQTEGSAEVQAWVAGDVTSVIQGSVNI